MEQQVLTGVDPRTALVATRCLMCRRRLRDAESVSCGIGPDCRDRMGFDQDMDKAVRREANFILVELACAPNPVALFEGYHKLCTIGLNAMAAKLMKHWASIHIMKSAAHIEIHYPYHPQAVKSMARLRGSSFKSSPVKHWELPTAQARPLFQWLQRWFKGHLALGDKGPFIVS